jgi:hypothetical protein
VASETSMEDSIAHLRNVIFGLETDPEPIDLAHVTTWNSWTHGAFICKFCDNRCDRSYEVHFQWGDTPRSVYLDAMCSGCLSTVCKKSRNATSSIYVIDETLPSIIYGDGGPGSMVFYPGKHTVEFVIANKTSEENSK